MPHAKASRKKMELLRAENKTILSLFDVTGAWSQPYREAGYNVLQHDIKDGWDILENFPNGRCDGLNAHGILAAPPCTDFSSSGAQYWKRKDATGETEESMTLVLAVLVLVEIFNPKWWAIENPVGRLPRIIPELGSPWYFQPHHYGDNYTKKTGLWGNFNRNLPRNDVEPVKACKQGSWLMKLGGKGDRTKMLRSITPPGFANSFFIANP
jgi:hypothetical protein